MYRYDETVPVQSVYLLQRYSKQWSQFIDVEGILDIENGDHLKVVPLPRALKKPEVGACIESFSGFFSWKMFNLLEN